MSAEFCNVLWFCTLATFAALAQCQSPGCGLSPPEPDPARIPHIWYKLELNDPVVGALTRWYVMHIPAKYDRSAATPLVFDLHGFSGSAHNQYMRTRMNEVSDTEGFITVYPDGMDDTLAGDGEGEKSWNAVGASESPGVLGPTCPHPPPDPSYYSCYASCKFGRQHSPRGAAHGCFDHLLASGCDSATCVDDRHFLQELLLRLQATLCIDKRRIHVTGFSNGAMMAYEFAFSDGLGTPIASIAPVAGAPMLGFLRDNQGRPRLKHAMAVLDMKGTLDDTIPANLSNGWDGGLVPGPYNSTWSEDDYFYTPTDNITAAFAEVNGCAGAEQLQHYKTEHDGIGGFYCVAPFGDCAHGAVVRCSFIDGHQWPFYYNTEQPYYAQTVWAFFKAHPLASPLVESIAAQQQPRHNDAESVDAREQRAGGKQGHEADWTWPSHGGRAEDSALQAAGVPIDLL